MIRPGPRRCLTGSRGLAQPNKPTRHGRQNANPPKTSPRTSGVGSDMASWAALAGSAAFGGLSARSWAQVARYWGDPAANPKPTALARFAGPAAQRRLTQGSLLNSVCLSGVTLLLLGGAWLPQHGGAGRQNPVAFTVALGGLAVFLAGCL